jgi:DNA-directed RNA polymerase specialized sigma24 family protein
MSLEGLATVPTEPRPPEKGLPLDFEEAYSKLTADQKRVFDLHYEQRLGFKEMATLLERKEATLRSVYNRAVARLRRELAAYDEAPGGRKRCRRRPKR